MNVSEITHAERVHEYIDKLEKVTNISLKNSPIILRSPSQRIIFEIPSSTKSAYEYVEQLYESNGEHDSLFKALRTGWSYIDSYCKKTPKSQEKYLQQLNHADILRIAKERGYSIPDNCLTEKQVCYGEYEAYYAVREILHKNAEGIWLRKPKFDNFMYSYAAWYKSVKLITSQFIVPVPDSKHLIPYIIDQLWVVSSEENRVRLLGLEIDGEYHFFNGGKSKTLTNDNHLHNLGYEMYHVASWWCRVDPYRVICEFLKASGIFPDAINYLVGAELKSIDDYKCGICHAPMVRCNWDWIQKCTVGNSTVLAHKSCAPRVSQNLVTMRAVS